MGHFKSKRLNMVTWMHWMLANMAFIIVSNAKNLLMDNPTPPPPPLPPTPDHEAIGEIGGKYFARYKMQAEMEQEQAIERAREICENVNGVLATQLDDQQFQSIFETEKLFFRKGGMLWIDAVYNFFVDGNIWTWANTKDEITAIKTSPSPSPTTEQELCGVMDAQMDYEPFYEPLIVGHDCGWSDLSENIGILCMSDEPIFD